MALQTDLGFFATQQVEETVKQNQQRGSPFNILQQAQTLENDQNKKINNLISQARYLKDQYAPLSQQNSNLKEYILAMNFYLDQRCKEFIKLLRDLPERQILKEIGDLTTVYELVREDIKYYQNLINGFIITQQKMDEEMKKIKEQEQQTISEYQQKIQKVITEAEQTKNQILEQIKEQKFKYEQQIDKQHNELKKTQIDLNLKVMECNRFNEIIIQQKRTIDKNSEEFKNEINTYENLIKRAKENYKTELRQGKNIYDNKLKEIFDDNKFKLAEIAKQHENEVILLKQQIQKITEDYINSKKDFETVNQKYLRTKGMLDLSQDEMREYFLEKKQLIRTSEQLQLVVDQKSEQVRQKEYSTQEFNEKIKFQQLKIESLEKKLSDQEEFWIKETQQYHKGLLKIYDFLEIQNNEEKQDTKDFIDTSQQIIQEKINLIVDEQKKLQKELTVLLEENKDLKNNFTFNEQYYTRELQNFLFEYNKLLKVGKNFIRRQEQAQLGIYLMKKEQPKIFRKVIRQNKDLFKEIKKKEERFSELEIFVQFSTRQQLKFNLQKNKILDEEIHRSLPWYLTEILSDTEDESNSVDPKQFASQLLKKSQLIDSSEDEEQEEFEQVEKQRSYQNSRKNSPKHNQKQIQSNIVLKSEEKFQFNRVTNTKEIETQTENILYNTETLFHKIDKETDTVELKTVIQQQSQNENEEKLYLCSQCQRELFQNNDMNDQSSNQTNYIQLAYQVDAFTFKNNKNISRESKTAQYNRVSQNDENYDRMTSSQKRFKKPQWKSQEVEVQTNQSRSNTISRQPSRELAQIVEETQQADDQGLGNVFQYPDNKINDSETFDLININHGQDSEEFSSPKHGTQTEKNFFRDNQDCDMVNSKIVSHRSLHSIVQQIQQMKRDKKMKSSIVKEVEKSPSSFTYDLEKNIDSNDKGYNQDTFNKGIQVGVKRKTQWVQTEDVENSEHYKKKYNELTEEYERRTKLQVQVLSSRENEKIKEIQQKQQKIGELVQLLEEKEATIESLQAYTLALTNTKSILEVALANESQKSRELQNQIVQIEQTLQKKKDKQIESLQKKVQENQIQIEDLNSQIINLKEELADRRIQFENECKYREQDKIKATKEQQKLKQIHEKEIYDIQQNILLLEQKLSDAQKQIEQQQKNFENRPSRPEDLEQIDKLLKQITSVQNNMLENYKSMSHANEIVKYLQIELENYKQMYNMFQKEPSEQSAKLNIENMRTTLFGNTYQKQLLKVIEVQSQLLNELQQKQNSYQPPTSNTTVPQNRVVKKKEELKKILALPLVLERSELHDQLESELDMYQNNFTSKEYGSVCRKKDSLTSHRKHKSNISEGFIDNNSIPKNKEIFNRVPQRLVKQQQVEKKIFFTENRSTLQFFLIPSRMIIQSTKLNNLQKISMMILIPRQIL